MSTGLLMFGLTILLVGNLTNWYLYSAFVGRKLGLGWWAIEALIVVGGIGLGSVLFNFEWYLSPTVRIIGFPFVAAVFELHNGLWTDYVGWITLPAAIGNFAVGLQAPHIFFAGYVWLHFWFCDKQKCKEHANITSPSA